MQAFSLQLFALRETRAQTVALLLSPHQLAGAVRLSGARVAGSSVSKNKRVSAPSSPSWNPDGWMGRTALSVMREGLLASAFHVD